SLSYSLIISLSLSLSFFLSLSLSLSLTVFFSRTHSFNILVSQGCYYVLDGLVEFLSLSICLISLSLSLSLSLSHSHYLSPSPFSFLVRRSVSSLKSVLGGKKIVFGKYVYECMCVYKEARNCRIS